MQCSDAAMTCSRKQSIGTAMQLQYSINGPPLYLKSIHPLCKVLEKVYHIERVNFQEHIPSVWFLRLYRGSNYFIKKCQMRLSTWHSHSPCVRYFLNFPHGCMEFEFEWSSSNFQIHWFLITAYELHEDLDSIVN